MLVLTVSFPAYLLTRIHSCPPMTEEVRFLHRPLVASQLGPGRFFTASHAAGPALRTRPRSRPPFLPGCRRQPLPTRTFRHSCCSSFPPSKPPLSMTTMPITSSLTSPRTSDRGPAAHPRPMPPLNTSLQNFGKLGLEVQPRAGDSAALGSWRRDCCACRVSRNGCGNYAEDRSHGSQWKHLYRSRRPHRRCDHGRQLSMSFRRWATTKLRARSSCSTNSSTNRRPLQDLPSRPTARPSVIAPPDRKPLPISAQSLPWYAPSAALTTAFPTLDTAFLPESRPEQ